MSLYINDIKNATKYNTYNLKEQKNWKSHLIELYENTINLNDIFISTLCKNVSLWLNFKLIKKIILW
jgi:hypothetical protein